MGSGRAGRPARSGRARPVTPKADPKSLVLAEDAKIPIVLSGTDVEDKALTYEVISVPSYGTL